MLLEGKRLLITGVLTPQSIAFAAARSAQEHGAEIVLTNFGRGVSLTEKVARRLPDPPDVLELDVNEPSHIERVRDELDADGAGSTASCTPSRSLRRTPSAATSCNTEWDSVATAVRTSAFSLKELAAGMLPLMQDAGGSIVSLDFDATVAWPIYDWMGVAKAGLESVTRYLARDLGPKGIRVNTVSAGPLRTMAGKGIPGFDAITDSWGAAGAARVGRDRPDPGRQHGGVPALGPVRGHHRRDDPRRRRLPRDGHRPLRRLRSLAAHRRVEGTPSSDPSSRCARASTRKASLRPLRANEPSVAGSTKSSGVSPASTCDA